MGPRSLLVLVVAALLSACGVLGLGSDGLEVEPGYQHNEWGSVPLLDPPLLADDGLTAVTQLEAKFVDGVPDDLLIIVTEVDYERFFVTEGIISLCSPPIAEDPRMVIEDGDWRLDHSTDVDENVLCDAPNRNWFLFVLDRVHRATFRP